MSVTFNVGDKEGERPEQEAGLCILLWGALAGAPPGTAARSSHHVGQVHARKGIRASALTGTRVCAHHTKVHTHIHHTGWLTGEW